MERLTVGQVLSLKVRFNNSGVVSKGNHPYIILDIDEDSQIIEIAQVDSLSGKEHKAAFRSNHVLSCTDPDETVIDKHSFVQMDNKFQIEFTEEILKCRRQEDCLSGEKLTTLIGEYFEYHKSNELNEDKIVFMSKTEILKLNAAIAA